MTSKYVPWLLTITFFGLLAFVWQDSRTQIAQRDLEIANLSSKFNKLVSESNTKIEEANVKSRQLVDEANQKISLANQREVQVRVAFRKAFLSSGKVASIANLSGQIIAITADVARPSSGQKKSFALTFDPGQTKEISEHEGWAFIPGDVITISQPDRKALAFTAP